MILGFSTGCLYKNLEPCSAEVVNLIMATNCNAIELCAIKPERLDYLNKIDVNLLKSFSYISLHAPDINYKKDKLTLEVLDKIKKLHEKFNFKTIVICPNYVKDFSVLNLDLPISFENMDKRKNFGTNMDDMKKVFTILPDSKMVLDLTHIFTNDPSMKLSRDFLGEFRDRIIEIHLSGYFIHQDGDEQQHFPIFISKQKEILDSMPKNIPIIIESVFPKIEIMKLKNELLQELNFIKSRL